MRTAFFSRTGGERYLSVRSCVFLFVFFHLMALIPSIAVGKETAFSPDKAIKELERLEKNAAEKGLDSLEKTVLRLNFFLQQGEQCQAHSEMELARLTGATTLGTEGKVQSTPSQPEIIKKKRNQAEQELANCRYLVSSAEAILSSVLQRKKQLQKKKLLYRQPLLPQLLFLRKQQNQQTALADLFDWKSGLGKLQGHLAPLAAILLLISLAVGWFSFWSRGKWGRHSVVFTTFTAVEMAVFSFLAMTTLVLGNLLSWQPPRPALVDLFLLAFFCFLVHMVLKASCAKRSGDPISGNGEERRPRSRLEQSGIVLAAAGIFIFYNQAAREFPEPLAALVDILAMFLTLSGAVLFLAAGAGACGRRFRGHTVVLLGLVCLAIVTHGAGYVNFGRFLYTAGIGTFTGFLLLVMGRMLLENVLGGLATGAGWWQQWCRRKIGIADSQVISGLIWLKLVLFASSWIGYLIFLVSVWNPTVSFLQTLMDITDKGIRLGSLHLEPARLFSGLVVFGCVWAAMNWLVGKVKQELSSSRLAAPARESAVAMFSYSGFAVALLIGLSVTGIEFANLAIIFGALSVGIGFGLQTIVNNFVSGLIIRFEQPIKQGDWIVVGATEGYVKKIGVRSTIIRTFDRADVIVPNSDILSAQVINWMFTDRMGRVRVPVGVAYGSDTAKVRQVLLDVARKHQLVLDDGDLTPAVLFMEFGESSLNFELRCFVRDVDQRLTTRSELNFAIDRAFRENGIEIPFPQRDLHLRSAPALAGIAGVGATETAAEDG